MYLFLRAPWNSEKRSPGLLAWLVVIGLPLLVSYIVAFILCCVGSKERKKEVSELDKAFIPRDRLPGSVTAASLFPIIALIGAGICTVLVERCGFEKGATPVVEVSFFFVGMLAMAVFIILNAQFQARELEGREEKQAIEEGRVILQSFAGESELSL